MQAWMETTRDMLPPSAEVIVVEQTDAHKFNRGLLLNVGFNKSLGSRVIFHDCDLVPDIEMLGMYVAPWISPIVHFGARFTRYNNGKSYFGGVTGFQRRLFPGFSNKYFGWGGEDDCLYRRVHAQQSADIWRPAAGAFTDLEFLPTVRDKLNRLTPKTKCMDKWELRASDSPLTDNHTTIPDTVDVGDAMYNEQYRCWWVHVFIK
tara:strand:+ start:103 stop:717 length:615 start_codon:yes stop_codon:yes gene_type:complete